MSNTNDGGPAFPLSGGVDQLESPFLVQGMSLRDYFAAKAMQAAITGAHGIGSAPDDQRLQAWAAVSRVSYEIADAMLKARQA